MSDPNAITQLKKRTGRLTWTARFMLIWERYAPVFALAGLIVGLFVIGSFSGIWERIGDPWRGIALIGALVILARTFWQARTQKFPSRSDARRRVEADSGARHRPLDTIDDQPAISSSAWPAHFEKAIRQAETLTRPFLRPVLKPIDPYFLRFALPAAIGLAMMVGAGDNFERLKRSLTPVWQSGISGTDADFEVWAVPPDYTGRPPIYFKGRDTVDIPAGSKLVARVSGVKSAPRLKVSTIRNSRYLPLERLGPDSFEATAIIDKDSIARWRIGNTQTRWALTAIPDQAPTVSVAEAPVADKRDRLSLTYSFDDDYGVEDLFLILKPLSEDPEIAEQIARIDVPISGSRRSADEANTAIDLTKHKWAGKKVTARLYARDGAGQSGGSADVFFTVPDKIFIEPLAKAVIEHRNLVLAGDGDYAPFPTYSREEISDLPWFDTYDTDNRLARAPEEIQRAALLIEAVTDAPEDIFRDPAVYMGLKNVLGRIRYAKSADALAGIPEDLWSIAIRAEFGVLGTALEEMREAEQNLRDGMARRAPQREIDTLFDRYDEAVERYMEELRQKALEEGNFAQGGGGGGEQNTAEIEELLKAIEEANRIGDTEGARLALAKLAELLENMQIQLAMGGGGGGDGPPMDGEMTEEMKKSLEELADLLGEQRELQDETQQAENEALMQELEEQLGQQPGGSENSQSGEGETPGQGSLSPEELAERQQALEEALEGLRAGIPGEEGEEPAPEMGDVVTPGGSGEDEDGEGGGQTAEEALDEAARAMQESEDALLEGDLDRSQDAQRDAISALRQAGEALAEQGQNRDGTAEAENGNDPLGRSTDGVNDPNAEQDIDQRDNATRSRELLEELRRRASEQEREKNERDYLERLLRRF